MKNIQEKLEKDVFSKSCGIELTSIAPGSAKAKMEIKENHMNSIGTVHGGAIFTLADLAYSAAANARGQVAVLIDAHISYIKAATTGTLYAEAQEESYHPKIASYRVYIKDDTSEVIAIFQGMCYRKKEKFKS